MIKVSSKNESFFVGIDHSVNKSAVCVLDHKGNIIGAAYFEKIKSSHKYIFTKYNSKQEAVSRKTLKMIHNKDATLIKQSPLIIESLFEDLTTNENSSEKESYGKAIESGKCFDDGGFTRTIIICREIIKYLKEFDNKDMRIVIEGYAFFGSGDITKIAENVGHLKALLYSNYWEVDMAQPNSIKLVITGFGKAGKEAVSLALKDRYGVSFENDDLNDAFAMAEYCRLNQLKLLSKVKVS